MKVGIIGSGFGAMAAAITLAQKGHKVTIFEKNETLGGKAGELKFAHCRFDTGPSLVTMANVFEDIAQVSEYVELKELETLCKYHWDDGTVITTHKDKEKLYEELLTHTSVTEKQLNKFFEYAKRIYNIASSPFLEQPFLDTGFKDPNNKHLIFKLGKIDPFRTMTKSLKRFFKDEKIIQLFQRYATYSGSHPWKIPATHNIIPYVEYELGAYYPTKGIRTLFEAYEKRVRSLGVEIVTNAPVQKILHKNKRATHVQTPHGVFLFDAIISGADPKHTRKLIRKAPKKREPSSSALVFYWAVKGRSSLDIHNIFFSGDYKKEFDQIFTGEFPDDPTVYINITSKYNRRDAPSGMENWFVMINAPATMKDPDIQKIKQHILEKLQIHGLEPNIVEEHIKTPAGIAKETNSTQGAIYGTASNSLTAAFFRQRNRSKEFKGLYYCGGSVHPGGGMALASLSGKFAAELCMEDNIKKR